MSLPYNYERTPDGSYKFSTIDEHNYFLYFSETRLTDSEDNSHIIFNIGFTRNGEYVNELFDNKFDIRIRVTITSIINNLFRLNDHRIMVYFCFGDDGYSRHRNIVFNRWYRDIDDSIEKHDTIISHQGRSIYGSLAITKDNPLKPLILNAFESYISDIANKEND